MRGCGWPVAGVALASLLGACGSDDGGPPAWDPQLGGTSEASTGAGDEAPASDGPTTVDPDGGSGGPGTCMPGSTVDCTCPDGAAGHNVCTPSGDAYFPCFEDRFEPVQEIMVCPDFSIWHYRNKHLEFPA